MKTKTVLACAISALLAAFDCAALTICPACGYEAEDGEVRCGHCDALLPETHGDAEPDASADDGARPAAAATDPDLAKAAFEAAREDAVFAKKEEAKRPALALQAYENAQALLAVATGDPRAAKAGEAIAEAILACRQAALAGSRTCTACNGSGKRTYVSRMLDGADTTRELSGSVCPVCNGRGKVRAIRSSDEIAGLVNSSDHEFGILRKGAGRVLCGRVWVPAEWTLSVEETALIRKARPKTCTVCAGFHDIDCRACKGLGHAECKAKGCKQGIVETKTANSLTPKNDITKREPCPVCKGTGSTPCVSCKGDGRVTCTACHGSGLPEACKTCSGEGIVPCRSCKGTGNDRKGQECRDCGGVGRQLCGACQGDGRKTR